MLMSLPRSMANENLSPGRHPCAGGPSHPTQTVDRGPVALLTFDPQVVSSKPVGLEGEGQGCIGLIQVDIHFAQCDALPLKHR